MKKFLQVSLGILIAGVVMLGIRIAYVDYVANVTMETLNKFTEELPAKNKARRDATGSQPQQHEQAKALGTRH